MMDVTLREAHAPDVPVLEIVRRQAIEHRFADEYDRSKVADLVAEAEADLPAWIESDHHDVILVESEVTVLAFGVLDRSMGVIEGVYTAPDYEREGWASRIVERMISLAREDGLDTLEATVPRPAEAFFLARGFEPGEKQERDGFPAQTMRKPL